MSALVRSELRKYLSTRMAWGMPLAMFLSGLAMAGLTAAFTLYGSVAMGAAELDLREALPNLALARMVYTGGITFGYLLTLVLGVLSMGQEARHRTATGTFLAAPRRSRVVLAKVLALVVIAVGNGVAHLAGALLSGGVLLAVNDLPVFPEPGELLRTLALALLVLVLWSLMGLGLGVLIPNQVAALFIAVALAWIVEPLLGWGLSLLEGWDVAARYFPSQASTATLSLWEGLDPQLVQFMGGSAGALPWWGGALTLVAYAAVLSAVGAWLTGRRDIT